MVFAILKALSLLLLIIVTHRYSHVLGGAFFAFFTAILPRTPILGKLFEKLIHGPIKIGVIIKFASWMLSASGMLLGIYIYALIFGMPDNTLEFWILLLSSLGSIINILYDFVLFQMITFKEHFAYSKNSIKKIVGEEVYEILLSDPKVQKSLSRSLFVDLYLPMFFKMLASMGVFYFSMGHLGFFELNPIVLTQPDLWECIKLSITFASFLDAENYNYFTGETWLISRIISYLLVFIYAAFFVAFAQSMFSDENEIKTDSEEKLLQELKELYPAVRLNPMVSNAYSASDKKIPDTLVSNDTSSTDSTDQKDNSPDNKSSGKEEDKSLPPLN